MKLLIASASDGLSWAEYIKNLLIENQYNIPSKVVQVENLTKDESSSYSFYLLFITPQLLDHAEVKVNLDELFPNVDHRMALLCSVEEEEFRKYANIMPEVSEENLSWSILRAGDSSDHVRKILAEIIANYESVKIDESEQLEECSSLTYMNMNMKLDGPDEEVFPPTCETSPYVNVESPEPHYSTPLNSQLVMQLIPQNFHAGNDIMCIVFRGAMEKEVSVIFNGLETPLPVQRLNSGTFVCKIPVDEPGEKTVQIYINKVMAHSTKLTIGSTQGLLNTILSEVSNPVRALCAAVGVSDTEDTKALDKMLTRKFQKQMPKSVDAFLSSQPDSDGKHATSFPTLLHFAAAFNLHKFAEEFLKCPITHSALHVQNCNGDCPHNLAKKRGHVDLASRLKSLSLTEKHDSGFLERDSGFASPTELGIPHSIPAYQSKRPYSSENSPTPGKLLSKTGKKVLHSYSVDDFTCVASSKQESSCSSGAAYLNSPRKLSLPAISYNSVHHQDGNQEERTKDNSRLPKKLRSNFFNKLFFRKNIEIRDKKTLKRDVSVKVLSQLRNKSITATPRLPSR